MSIGAIIFIIGVIITIGQSILEKMGNQQKTKPVVRKIQEFEKRVQTNINRLEQRTTIEAPQQTAQVKKQVSKQLQNKTSAERPKKVMDDVEKVLADTHLTEQQKINRLEAIKENDLTESDDFKFEINNENLVHGLIMAELLASPKSRR